MKILHVDSSITGDQSLTRKLSKAIVARLTELAPDGATVVQRDVVAQPLPYFTFDMMAGIGVAPALQPAENIQAERVDQKVLAEFMNADVIVIGTPMYNFTIPAQLKSWLDFLAVRDVTFRYTPTGPVGLAGGRKVIIGAAQGGIYAPGSPAASAEHQISFVRTMMRFFGITDITVVQAEGVRLSPERADAAMAQAMDQIRSLTLA